MNATFKVLCYKSKTLSNGENPLMICVSKEGKRKYVSLGISVNPKFWDFAKNEPKRNCPNKELILVKTMVETIKTIAAGEYDLRNKASHELCRKIVDSGLLNDAYLPFI